TRASYWLGPILIGVCHLGAGFAVFTGLSLSAWIWIVVWYEIRMLAITSVYHRLLAHKAYSSPAWFKWVGSFVAASAGQMGPSWWKGHHEVHHRLADQADEPHSSVKGFWWSHYRWLLSQNFIPSQLPADVERDWVLRIIDRLHFLPLLALGLLSYGIGGLDYLIAFFVSTTLLFHGVALVNSACHTSGSSPFQTDDNSRNNRLVAMLTLGEGWHNFHHAFPWSARQGITVVDDKVQYLPDFTYSFIQGLQRIGIASKVRLPSNSTVSAGANHARNHS
ncbi:MAG: acyl-CoA desaturase, partial [Leptolyngbya sp. SIO4C1]|nr:acyl-CoA desaturase [Leptolyngbya sp. SIO4C1]